MRFLKLVLSGILLCSCATSFTVPVTGTIGKTPAQGNATARLSGEGDFWVATIDGLRCEGKYDSLDTTPTIVVPTTCNDGRSGTLLITRSLRGISGTVTGKLNDGTQGRFVFGDLSFSQAFGETTTNTAN
ncbi:hypothetical protein [Actibacterium mucosum]|uniref:hypothetical protein n=1 Tax=Actibacterium mucosum TaxID=1087332 RepID=UPI001268ECF5|nr:hypothetical protein [Actibacterium mucosum]